jgi:hypothetical protein
MEGLVERLSRAEIDRLAEEIAELSAHIDAASHRLLTLIRRFDAESGWHQQGALTCAHWLSWRIGLDLGAAREHVRVARALGGLPLIDEALRRGQVSYSKVRALTRVATQENEATLLHWARSATASQLERICRKYRSVKRRDLLSPEDEAYVRFVRVRDTESGMVRIEAQLSPEEAAVVLKTLEVTARRAEGAGDVAFGDAGPIDVPKRTPRAGVSAGVPAGAGHARWTNGKTRRAAMADTGAAKREGSTPGAGVSAETTEDGMYPQAAVGDAGSARCMSPAGDISAGTLRSSTPKARLRRADALVAMAEDCLAGQAAGQSCSPPVEIVVHLEHGAALLDDGTPLSPSGAARLLCDASIVPVVEDASGTPLDVGRRTRVIPAALKRALRLRDRGCRFPSCTHQRVDAHHIVPWSEGGATRLGNTLLLCRTHHRFVHEHGYRIEQTARGEIAFFDPRGREVPRSPAPPDLEFDGESLLLRTNEERGIEIDARTSLPSWDGRPADHHLAVAILCQRDGRAVSPYTIT